MAATLEEFESSFATEVAERFDMMYRFTQEAKPEHVAILASKTDPDDRVARHGNSTIVF